MRKKQKVYRESVLRIRIEDEIDNAVVEINSGQYFEESGITIDSWEQEHDEVAIKHRTIELYNELRGMLANEGIYAKLKMIAIDIIKEFEYERDNEVSSVKDRYTNYYLFANVSNELLSVDYQEHNKAADMYEFKKTCKRQIEKIKRVTKLALQKVEIEDLPENFLFSGEVTGMIIHEAIGHPLEDGYHIWSEGDILSDKKITVIDNPYMNGMVGSIDFDDYGERGCTTVLVDNSVIKAVLSNNKRREDYRCRPKSRMTNTFMQNNISGIKQIPKDYVYVYDSIGGGINYETRVINLIVKGVVIKNNVDKEIVQLFIQEDVNIFFKKVNELGDQIYWANCTWCFKDNDKPIPVKYGGPDMLMSNIKYFLM